MIFKHFNRIQSKQPKRKPRYCNNDHPHDDRSLKECKQCRHNYMLKFRKEKPIEEE